MKEIVCKSFLNGTAYGSGSQEGMPLVFPATNEIIGQVEFLSESGLDDAVASCKEAQRVWAAYPPAERARVLNKTAALARARVSELALLEVMDSGKPLQEALAVDIFSGAEALEYFASACAVSRGAYLQLGANYAQVLREPLGVVAGIGAWNYPFQIACWKAAPALAAGNAMIFKPSEMTPRSAVVLAEIFQEAGLPDGVFNVVQGGAKLGQSIVRHPEIKKVSLTGEVDTGKKVFADAASTLKYLTLELGGKSPLILFEDADLHNAVQGAMLANFYTQGEICSNGTRVFVHESIVGKFLDQLKDCTSRLITGDPRDEKTQIGALISKEHREKVKGYLAKGKSEGAEIFLGGGEPEFSYGSPLNEGNFILPTVFVGCTDAMAIVKEEIFGPVMSVLTFKDEDEVLERANNTPYGLAAGLFTRDLRRSDRVCRQLQAGICWVNTYNITPLEAPFGGFKHSGLGRENSMEALEAYTQSKTIYVETQDIDSPYRPEDGSN